MIAFAFHFLLFSPHIYYQRGGEKTFLGKEVINEVPSWREKLAARGILSMPRRKFLFVPCFL